MLEPCAELDSALVQHLVFSWWGAILKQVQDDTYLLFQSCVKKYPLGEIEFDPLAFFGREISRVDDLHGVLGQI